MIYICSICAFPYQLFGMDITAFQLSYGQGGNKKKGSDGGNRTEKRGLGMSR